MEVAVEFGATHTFDATDKDVVAKVIEATGGGVDFAVDLAGVIKAIQRLKTP